MKKLIVSALMLIVFCVGNTSTIPVKASPTVHNVGPNPGQFPTITAALTSGLVQPGDVIHVWYMEAPYQENPVITIPNIKIIGEYDIAEYRPKAVVVPAVPGVCFTIQAPDVTIMALAILDQWRQPGDIAIAIMPPGARCNIIGNWIEYFDWGVLISDSPDNQIILNVMEHCLVTPPPPFCSTGLFIYGPNSIRNVVRGNDIFYNSLGVQTNLASGNTITFNNFVWWYGDPYSPPGNIPQANVAPGDINQWCDPSLQKGNYWGDSSPQPPYVIDPNNIDQFCSPNVYTRNQRWDINLDLKCDIKDVATAAAAFGTTWSMPKWNPMTDIAGGTPRGDAPAPDGKIDIKDIATIASKFGWSDP